MFIDRISILTRKKKSVRHLHNKLTLYQFNAMGNIADTVLSKSPLQKGEFRKNINVYNSIFTLVAA